MIETVRNERLGIHVNQDSLYQALQEFTFNKKLEIIKQLGILTDSLKLKLPEVNLMRNKCVHSIDYIQELRLLSGLSINILNLKQVKMEGVKMLIELNEVLAKSGR